MAIIPLKDNRLKPRRTWLVILITIILCALIAGLVLFFVVPRSITAESLETDRVLHPDNVTLEEFDHDDIFEQKVYHRLNISFLEPVYLKNDNFFPVEVQRMIIDVNHATQNKDGSLVMTLLTHYDNASLPNTWVPVRSSSTVSSELSITLDDREDGGRQGFNTYLIKQCLNNPSWWSYITVSMNATVFYDYLGNVNRQSLTYDRRLGCFPYADTMSTFPTTDAIPTTTAPNNGSSVSLNNIAW